MSDNCRFLCPVRPSSDDFPLCQPCEDEGWETIDSSHTLPAMDIGKEDLDILDAEDGDVVQKVKAMPAPILPTQAEIDAHNLTHWPYRS